MFRKNIVRIEKKTYLWVMKRNFFCYLPNNPSDHFPWRRRLRILLETHCLFSTQYGAPLVR